MIKVSQSPVFAKWLRGLRDRAAQVRITARIDRMAVGVMGDVKSVGEGVSEARINYGPGYRLYFMRQGERVILLLCGGDKSSQAADIAKAKKMAKELE